MNMIGQQVKRVDAYGKVTGEAKYTADLKLKRYSPRKGCSFYYRQRPGKEL